jgi:hypothetical protein
MPLTPPRHPHGLAPRSLNRRAIEKAHISSVPCSHGCRSTRIAIHHVSSLTRSGVDSAGRNERRAPAELAPVTRRDRAHGLASGVKHAPSHSLVTRPRARRRVVTRRCLHYGDRERARARRLTDDGVTSCFYDHRSRDLFGLDRRNVGSSDGARFAHPGHRAETREAKAFIQRVQRRRSSNAFIQRVHPR